MELKDCIHFYYGGQCLFDNKNWTINRIGQLYIRLHRLRPLEDMGGGDHYTEILLKDMKLVLRRLDSMTEEEKYEVVTTITYSHVKFSTRQSALESFDVDRYNKKHNNEFYPDEFLYLLRKGFDLFNLIESGQAIDAATLTPESHKVTK